MGEGPPYTQISKTWDLVGDGIRCLEESAEREECTRRCLHCILDLI